MDRCVSLVPISDCEQYSTLYPYELIMNQTKSLQEAIKADFLEITKNYLEFWKENINLLDIEDYSSQPRYYRDYPSIQRMRIKRSGLQKILQVDTIIKVIES